MTQRRDGAVVGYSDRHLAAWPALYVAALSFAFNLGVNYPLVEWSCAHQQHALEHIVHAICLAIALWGTWHGWRLWQAHRDATGSDAGDHPTQRQFLGLIGTFASALFSLGIAAQWFTTFVVPACLA